MTYPNDETPIVPVVARQYRDAHRETGTKGTLVQTARALFESQGVASTTLAAVARGAHVSRTLLYYYFSSKDELVEAVLNDCAEDFVDSISLWNESRVFGHTPQELANFSRTLGWTCASSTSPSGGNRETTSGKRSPCASGRAILLPV